MKQISPSEFWVFWGLIFAARVHGRQGCVWMRDDPDRIGFKVDFPKTMTKTKTWRNWEGNGLVVC